MTYEEFQHLARLYIVGSLDAEEMERFTCGRERFGPRAEAFIDECRKLNAVFALSLHPRDPAPDTKQRLMARIRESASDSATRPPSVERTHFSSRRVALRLGLN